ncbi:hypothetical protein [Haloferula rosea]|uniref:VanZ family protein n=1 Tax=Haloferula rosea TaxID=490093 RepID=A0A934R9V7_9BACT|nr:hypothetical protein [Haloferula rosea]MBK1827834.1 hypothetical protein [Haloferula rosea]
MPLENAAFHPLRHIEATQASPLHRFVVDARSLELPRLPGSSPINHAINLPVGSTTRFLHSRISIEAIDLVVGSKRWESGRVLIMFHDKTDRLMSTIPLGSAEFDQRFDGLELVAEFPDHAAEAKLVFQNLGSSGLLRIDELIITPVIESRWWTIGRWVVAAGWFGWFFVLSGRETNSWLRRLLAAGVVLYLAASLAFPGPWKPHRAIGQGFQLAPTRGELAFEAGSASLESIPAPIDKIDRGDTLIVRLKHRLRSIRPVLHAGLFVVITLGLASLVGMPGGGRLAIALAIAIEGSQVAYGFKWELSDFWDLAFNLLGVAIGLAFFSRTLQPVMQKLLATDRIIPERRRG